MDKQDSRAPIFIGVVGQISAGKGVLVDYLKDELDFISFSLSSILHLELKKREVTNYTRKSLQDLGDELRKKEGNGVLAKMALSYLKKQKDKRVVIEGIRNPGEIELLKKEPSFTLIGVKAYQTIRFKRLLKRAKPWDPKTYEDFIKVDKRDLGVGQDKSGQQVGKCLAYCDYVLTNNGGIEEFQNKVKRLMEKIFDSI
ncbi:hypothetical protein B6D29_02460 [Microgenomates bacterium UTCPR1]|nr:MAG: hypothetical protein B6D29_02460 [Microgenomates bacterium UTCPR1]